MPDGSTYWLRPPPVERKERGFGPGAALAVVLHGLVLLPFLLHPAPPPASATIEDVEFSPVSEAPAQQAAESVAETAATAPTDPVQTTETPPPDSVQAESPPESIAPPRPPDPLQVTSPDPTPVVPSEPVMADIPPPEPLPAETPDTAEVVQPPEEVTTAALPPPPPPAPPPPQPIRAAAPPRPAPRPAQPAPPRPVEAAATAPAGIAAPVAPAPRSSSPPPSYVGRLLAALERHKDYPMAARFRRAEGTVLLRFAMRRDGTVASWRIDRTSGHEDLDAAVAQMIRRASPLPAPPPELAGDPVEVVVPVRFTLR